MNPPPIAHVTKCCASTSSGLLIGIRGSISPASSARRAAVTSNNSSACVGTHVILHGAIGRWLLRPARTSTSARCITRTPACCRERTPPMCVRHELSPATSTSAPVSRT